MTTKAQHSIFANSSLVNPFQPVLPGPVAGKHLQWGQLYGSASGLVISNAARQYNGPLVLITSDMPSEEDLYHSLQFYTGQDEDLPIFVFPDRETLPYDVFSPHQDIISERLGTLYHLPTMQKGIVIIPITTLMHRLPPRDYLINNSLMIDVGDRLDINKMRLRLESSGYRCVSQVMEHGEFTVRGSLIDLFPMGSHIPYRIDLFDDEIDSIRTFDPESQRTIQQVDKIRLMPAREFPLTEEAIDRFRQNFRNYFEGDPQNSIIYREVSEGNAPAGIEYFLPLFFEKTDTFLDYLPDSSLILISESVEEAADSFNNELLYRYEQRRHDIERPILTPDQLFLNTRECLEGITRFPGIHLQNIKGNDDVCNYDTHAIPQLSVVTHTQRPLSPLLQYLESFSGRVLIVAESTGRRETLLEILRDNNRHPVTVINWQEFLSQESPLCITVATLDKGIVFHDPDITVITESQLFGEQAMQSRRRKKRDRDVELIIRNLTELEIGAPVVHEEHGVGRYLGLNTLEVSGIKTEFLTLQYAGDDKLYVPVSSLHLISRYTGSSPESAPLHKLGTEQWSRAKRRAAERIRDVAAELLDLYARRAARKGHAFPAADDQYAAFAAAFPFEETPDQHDAINDVIKDMESDKPMDRLICGDVGFGKTEVAMRAAFMAVQGNKQVAVLVPTTLLAQQHYQNFRDRFADLPVQIELLSRFRTKKQQDETVTRLENGTTDIVISTHKLIQGNINFKQLGLIIVDEEHRFGVRQKEKLKAIRANVDTLALTATPIPRTLNMALTGIRDLSIIATAPLKRLAIKTFVSTWNDALISEACLREIKRGGQVYVLHNEVRTIDKMAQQIEKLVPEAKVRVAHGQMREMELEQIMLDFYHHRFSILVCSTIIESGIDVPSANTIIMNRADKLGLAQLYQLRGRVGRSHHQAYAYLIAPPRKAMTADAIKRLEAIESIEELGAGFTLATHDLEIRGAGEFLGDEQSGHIQEIGFSMYTELLERAVEALKSGKQVNLDQPLNTGSEIDLKVSALIPDDYIPDVHTRLVMYKRISNAQSSYDLDELQVEMIDRFGLLPEPAKNLFKTSELKIKASTLGIQKIEAGPAGARIIFRNEPNIDPAKIFELIQKQPKMYRFDGQNKLRIEKKMADFEERVKTSREIMDAISF